MNKHIGFKIRTLSNLIHWKINQMVAEEEETLTASQAWVLGFLVRQSGREIVQKDIEKEFFVRRSTASYMLALMENNGYISRVAVPRDARMKRIILTEKGRQAQERMTDRLRRFELLMSEGMTDEEQEMFLAMVGQCAVILGTTLTVIMVLARQVVIQAFINDAEVIAYGIQMVIALQLSGPVLGILFLCINTIQGMGKAIPSLVLTICRQGLIFIPAIYTLNAVFGLDGAIYAQPVADFISIVLSLCICLSIFRKMDKAVQGAGSSE